MTLEPNMIIANCGFDQKLNITQEIWQQYIPGKMAEG